MSRRLQQRGEPFTCYITEILKLVRRHGGITAEREFQYLYRNTVPEFQLQIRKDNFGGFGRIFRNCQGI